MVSFSTKPGDQTDKTDSPNLVNKTELTAVSTKAFLSFYSISCSEKFQIEEVANWSKATRNKRSASWIYDFSAEVLPALSKLEIGIVKLKLGGILLYSLLILVGVQSSLTFSIKNMGGWVQVELYLLDKIHFKRDEVIYFVDGPFFVLNLCLIFHLLFLFFRGVCFAFFGFFNLYLVLGFVICNSH